ncbi:hypothetical protein [Epilithonimonas hungarica]|uniref:Lipoprotein n=1 Tax=Epilithonimonas hungarica TaxID=454006 RepID=A0A1G7RLL1_9FLAO|nr:hypothetical protein [Epilithonimonas hungarica]SDG10970.1 hypothetical protein SAMN05421825_2691 [Epilithonimonas hungarica]
MRKLISYIVLLLILINCNSSVKSGDSTLNEKVPYKEAKNYFVKNNIDAVIDSPKFETQQEFDKVFGMATTMRENGKPTPIDFSKEFVVAQIEDPSTQSIELKPVSIRKNSNVLEIKYKRIAGENQSYTTQTAMILIIDRKSEGDINFVEVQ